MRGPQQGPRAFSARNASRQPGDKRRAEGVGSSRGFSVRVGQGALGLPHLGFSLTGQLARSGQGRTVISVWNGLKPSCPALAGIGVAGCATLGRAPLSGASRGARRGLTPGLPVQAFRLWSRPWWVGRLGLGLWDGSWLPGDGHRVCAKWAPATVLGPNLAVSQRSGLGPDTVVFGGRDQSLMPRRGRVVLEVDPAARGGRVGPSGLRRRACRHGFQPARTSVRRSSPRPKGCVIAEAREPVGSPAGT